MYSKTISSGFFSLLGLLQAPLFPSDPSLKVPSLTEEDWGSFNASVNGRLHRSTKLWGPCYTPDTHLSSSNSSSHSVKIQAGQSSWQSCQEIANRGNDGFFLDVQNPQDVVLAFKLAKTHGARLVVDHLDTEFCRSPAQDSLALWMHNLESITYTPKFTPFSCNPVLETEPAITYEAGVSPEKLHSFADSHGVTVVGDRLTGSEGSPFGILTPSLGASLDNILEYQAITPDGLIRRVNKCHNTDLWYAMRGSASSSYAVVISVTVNAYPSVNVRTFSASFKSSLSITETLLRIITENTLKWAAEGWGGYINKSEIVLATPLLTISEASQSLSPLTDYLRSLGSQSVQAIGFHEDTSIDLWTRTRGAAIPTVDHQTALFSRLIPESLVQNTQGREDLAKAIIVGSTMVEKWSLHFASPYGLSRDLRGPSSIHPALYKSPLLVVFQNMVNDSMSFSDRIVQYSAVGKAGNYVRFLTPNSGTYYSHGDLSEPEHEKAFWGEHYPELLLIKKRHDPLGLLTSWKSVGWKGRDDPKYGCYTPAKLQIVPCETKCR
ncbi:hypothetical protein FRC03_005745 [Tulasnella sp. 419]|nr:hypothetical protein FRC03_005745 [Tulasnella sp. 419]